MLIVYIQIIYQIMLYKVMTTGCFGALSVWFGFVWFGSDPVADLNGVDVVFPRDCITHNTATPELCLSMIFPPPTYLPHPNTRLGPYPIFRAKKKKRL